MPETSKQRNSLQKQLSPGNLTRKNLSTISTETPQIRREVLDWNGYGSVPYSLQNIDDAGKDKVQYPPDVFQSVSDQVEGYLKAPSALSQSQSLNREPYAEDRASLFRTVNDQYQGYNQAPTTLGNVSEADLSVGRSFSANEPAESIAGDASVATTSGTPSFGYPAPNSSIFANQEQTRPPIFTAGTISGSTSNFREFDLGNKQRDSYITGNRNPLPTQETFHHAGYMPSHPMDEFVHEDDENNLSTALLQVSKAKPLGHVQNHDLEAAPSRLQGLYASEQLYTVAGGPKLASSIKLAPSPRVNQDIVQEILAKNLALDHAGRTRTNHNQVGQPSLRGITGSVRNVTHASSSPVATGRRGGTNGSLNNRPELVENVTPMDRSSEETISANTIRPSSFDMLKIPSGTDQEMQGAPEAPMRPPRQPSSKAPSSSVPATQAPSSISLYPNAPSYTATASYDPVLQQGKAVQRISKHVEEQGPRAWSSQFEDREEVDRSVRNTTQHGNTIKAHAPTKATSHARQPAFLDMPAQKASESHVRQFSGTSMETSPNNSNQASSVPIISVIEPMKVESPDPARESRQEHTYERPKTGGKSITPEMLRLMDISGTNTEDEKNREEEEEGEGEIEAREWFYFDTSPINDEDSCHWQYFVTRKVWTSDQDEDEAEWQQFDGVYTSLSETNDLATERLNSPSNAAFVGISLSVQYERHADTGMATNTLKGTKGTVRLAVQRQLVAYHDYTLPESKEGWLRKKVYDIYYTVQDAEQETSSSSQVSGFSTSLSNDLSVNVTETYELRDESRARNREDKDAASREIRPPSRKQTPRPNMTDTSPPPRGQARAISPSSSAAWKARDGTALQSAPYLATPSSIYTVLDRANRAAGAFFMEKRHSMQPERHKRIDYVTVAKPKDDKQVRDYCDALEAEIEGDNDDGYDGVVAEEKKGGGEALERKKGFFNRSFRLGGKEVTVWVLERELEAPRNI